MASYTIPLIFTARPKPGKHFTLDVPDARKNPDPIDEFASKTWTCCTEDDYGRFAPTRKNGSRPRVKDVIASRLTKPRWRLKGLKRFSQLPFELKNQIWESCLEPQTHTVICLVELDDTRSQILSKTWLLESPGNMAERRALSVPLFHICRQSRAVALGVYRRLDPGVYFSPMMDTLRLSLVSTTTISRHEGGIYHMLRIPAGGNPDPPFSGADILSRMGISSTPHAVGYCLYWPSHTDWTQGYTCHHHEYGPPYLLSRIPHEIMSQVQNLQVLFHYEPYKAIQFDQSWRWYRSQLHIYFMMDNCPILDLTGLRTLVLKVAVVTAYWSPKGAESWSQLVHKIVALPPAPELKKTQEENQERGLYQLRSLEVIKVCSAEDPKRYCRDWPRQAIPASFSRMKTKVLTKLSKKNWRP
ncbi:hypothetical protein V8F33_008255 [Rhypophila sp. PSN 637]